MDTAQPSAGDETPEKPVKSDSDDTGISEKIEGAGVAFELLMLLADIFTHI